jgi:3-oxoacyl-[acyl-carrier-protein] synthase I
MADVVVLGVGITSAVGLTATETAASVRAGTMRISETPFRDKQFRPFVVAEVPEDGLPPLAETLIGLPDLTTREQRMLRLASMPLRECLAPLSGTSVPVGLCLALPECETTRPLDRARFLQYLSLQMNGTFDPKGSDASHSGRAGGLVAVGQAVATIQQGVADFVLAGGIDSYRDLYVLGTLDLEQRVKSEANWDGFIPGEGASFLLLASARAAAMRGLRPLASLSGVAMGTEAGHLYSTEPYRGDGLAGVIRQLFAQAAPDAPVSEVFSSMNGESHWAKEWGVGMTRNRAMLDPSHRLHHPAESLGDTGAACGPLMVGLAALGIAGQYRRSPALVYGSSDHGARAALVVNAPQH